jgi:hypothetical protein
MTRNNRRARQSTPVASDDEDLRKAMASSPPRAEKRTHSQIDNSADASGDEDPDLPSSITTTPNPAPLPSSSGQPTVINRNLAGFVKAHATHKRLRLEHKTELETFAAVSH